MLSDGEWLFIFCSNYKPIVYFNCLGSNFNGLQSKDLPSEIKGREFCFKDSINPRVRMLQEKGQKFKELAIELLYAMTRASYKNAQESVEEWGIMRKYTNFLDDLSGGMIDDILFSVHLKGMRIPEVTRLKWCMQVGFISVIYIYLSNNFFHKFL